MILQNMISKFPQFPILESEVVSLFECFGFVVDTSHQHDICPSVSNEDYSWTVMVDHPDCKLREFESNPRFSFYALEDGQIFSEAPAFVAETFDELKKILMRFK